MGRQHSIYKYIWVRKEGEVNSTARGRFVCFSRRTGQKRKCAPRHTTTAVTFPSDPDYLRRGRQRSTGLTSRVAFIFSNAACATRISFSLEALACKRGEVSI